jgi:hypothetical protein
VGIDCVSDYLSFCDVNTVCVLLPLFDLVYVLGCLAGPRYILVTPIELVLRVICWVHRLSGALSCVLVGRF